MTADELVLVIGLDASNFTAGQKAALDAFNKTQEAALKGGKAIEEQSKKSMDALGGLKTQALELFAALGGGAAMVGFVSKITTMDAATGRLSRALGVSGTEISKWQGVAREFGSTGEAMAGSFQSISDVFTAWNVGGSEAPAIMARMAAITRSAQQLDQAHAKVFDPSKGQSQFFKDLAANLKIIHDLSPDKNLAHYLSEGIPNIDPGFFDLLIRGSDRVSEALDRTRGATKAEIDAAGELAQAWNKLGVAIEGKGRSSGATSATALMVNTVTKDVSKPWFEWSLEGLKNTTGSEWWETLKQGLVPKHGYIPEFLRSPSDTAAKPGSSAPSSDINNPAYRSAIAAIESRGSGGYAAQGPVTASGDRALGRYQVMSSNVAPWSKAALGREMSASEFLASPEAQDKIFDFKFGEYARKFGNPQDAASAWFTGKPLAEGANRHDLFGTTGAAYAQRFSANMATDSSSTTTTTVAINGPITINAGPSASASEIANKLRDLGIRRQAEANQSSVGPQ